MDTEQNYLAYGDTVIKMLVDGGYELKYNFDAHIEVINELSISPSFKRSRNGVFTLTYLNINLLEAILKEKIKFKAELNKTNILEYEQLELICLIDKYYVDVDLPTGEYLTEETSPDGTYTIRAYRNNGGATTSYSIRGELVFNKNNSKTKNIYWNYREDTAEIEWTDNDTVIINGHTLEVPNERFDFRNQ